MTIEAEIYTRLSTHVGLSALIALRVHPNTLPQGVTMPAVSFRRVSALRETAMGSDPGIVRARFQFDCWAEGSAAYDSARAVAEEVRAALQRWRNTSGTVVQDTFMLNEIETYDTQAELHRVAVDFEIIYEE